MKREIFNQYIEKLCALFNITLEEFFTKTKNRDVVDARQMLYYLCSKRNITVGYIQKYLMEKDFYTSHSTISHSIKVMGKRAEKDRDYTTILNKIEKETTL